MCLCVGNSCFCCPPLLSTDISDLLECVANILKIKTDCVGRTFDDQNRSHIIYTFNDKLLIADFHFPSFTFSRLNKLRFMLASYCFKLITRLINALLTLLPSSNRGLKRRLKSRLCEQFWFWWALLKQRATRTQDVDSTNLYSTNQAKCLSDVAGQDLNKAQYCFWNIDVFKYTFRNLLPFKRVILSIDINFYGH